MSQTNQTAKTEADLRTALHCTGLSWKERLEAGSELDRQFRASCTDQDLKIIDICFRNVQILGG